jgi:ParB family transcriptional regulator, chromosome partitioning protein
MGPFLPPVQSLPLDLVDWEDRRFAIESFLPRSQIMESLSRFGLLTPPWVVKAAGEKFIIVDGFKRLCELRDQGTGQVRCVVFPAETSLNDLWALRLEARLFGPPLNIAEKAQVVARLAAISMEGNLARRFQDALALPHRPEMLDKWKRLAEAGRDLLEAASRGDIHERAALELARWPEDPEERSELVSILRKLRCSASIQVEILERFRDITTLSSQPVRSLLQSGEPQRILGHPEWNHREKTQALRDWLDTLRLPRLKARERHFTLEIGRTPPPSGVSLVPPPSFEGNRWRLEVTFASPEELRHLLEKTNSWSLAAGLGKLLNPQSELSSGEAPSNRRTSPS